jgi:hypothetical protein
MVGEDGEVLSEWLQTLERQAEEQAEVETKAGQDACLELSFLIANTAGHRKT